MKVLHICNDYFGSKVHRNLYEQLDKLGVEQTIYTYFRDQELVDKNRFSASHTNFEYRQILKLYHRGLYHLKVRTVYHDLTERIDVHSYDLVHAVTLFSDGGVAYRIYKELGIPYVVAVRNTDINTFLSVAPHTWSMGVRILKNARKIVFISRALIEKFSRHRLIRYLLPEIEHKFVLQPNGVDDYWLEHIRNGGKNQSQCIIYIGRFDHNKNVVRLIDAVLELQRKRPNIRLHLVGGGGDKEKNVLNLVRRHPDVLQYHGKVYEKDMLRHLYGQCSIFAMPSIHETFGLVYIEALTQNLALLYTRNQGIDGLLDQRVGEKVNPYSKRDIKEALVRLLDNRQAYMAHEVVDFSLFRWSGIAKSYLNIYKSIIHI